VPPQPKQNRAVTAVLWCRHRASTIKPNNPDKHKPSPPPLLLSRRRHRQIQHKPLPPPLFLKLPPLPPHRQPAATSVLCCRRRTTTTLNLDRFFVIILFINSHECV
jgi:hypothetical protein